MSEIVGHELLRAHLAGLIKKGTVPHALLFSGSEGIGKGLVAVEFAGRLIAQGFPQAVAKVQSGNHPDLHIYHTEGKANLHSISALRLLSREVAMKPNESEWKVFIIHDAEKMLPTSANALLKTLEEPSSNTVIILISSNSEKLLPTIVSRCRQISFYPLAPEDVAEIMQEKWGIPSTDAAAIASFSQGSLARAQWFLKEKDRPLRQKMIEILIKSSQLDYFQLHREIEQLHEILENEKGNYEKALRKELGEEGEKEIERLVNTHYQSLIAFLLETFLLWHRDIDAIQQKVPLQFLCHQDYLEELKEQKMTVALDKIYQAVLKAQLAQERSLKFTNSLENLFLLT